MAAMCSSLRAQVRVLLASISFSNNFQVSYPGVIPTLGLESANRVTLEVHFIVRFKSGQWS